MRRFDRGLQLLRRELRRARPLVARSEHRARRHDLDDIGTRGDLLADGFDDLARAIGLPVHALPRRRAGGRHRNDLAGEDETRRADQSLVGGAPQRELEVVASTDVADRGEAGREGAASVLGHPENAQPRGITILNGRIGETGVGQVDVTVDQSWRDRPIWNIDPRDIAWGVDTAADGADAIAFDEHRARPLRRGAGAIDERASRDEDCARAAQGEREV